MILKNMHIFIRYFLLLFIIGIFSCVDNIREVTLFSKGSVEASASATVIDYGQSIDFSSTNNKANALEWTFQGGSPSSSLEENVSVTYNTPGTFQAKLEVTYIDNTKDSKIFTITVNGPDDPVPFSGTPIALPGVIEAENYDLGGQGVGYNDTEEENLAVTAGSASYRDDDGIDIQVGTTVTNIGYTNIGEWTHYTVSVANAGLYDFSFQVASGSTTGGKSIKLQLFNTNTGGTSDLGETGDFANTGGWGNYVSLPLKNVNLLAGKNTLRVLFTGGGTNLDKINITPAITGGGGGPLGPLKIAFVTDNPTSDAGYITLLEGEGHTVEAEAGKYNNLNTSGAATLNTFDLVIISRNTNSGNFNQSIAGIWATVNKPILNMSSYVARSSRLQFFDSANQVENAGNSIKAVVTSHPVFTNISLGANNTFDITAAGLHVIGIADAGNGTLIATTGNDAYATIAEWDANTAAYNSGTVFSSKRMFLAGTGGGFTYNEAGSQLFLNCVEYIVTGSVGSGSSAETLGFYTERTTTERVSAERPPSNSGNFNISYVTNAAEGNEAIYANFATSGTGNDVTWGAMVSMYTEGRGPLNLADYNFYHISLKAPAENSKAIRLRFRTAGGNYWLTLSTVNQSNYGFSRDGNWHNLKIPLTDLLKDGTGAPFGSDKSNITEVIFRSDVSAAELGSNFDWYIDDIYFSK